MNMNKQQYTSCNKCYSIIRVDDLYNNFYRTGRAVRKCERCGMVNNIAFQMDGKISANPTEK